MKLSLNQTWGQTNRRRRPAPKISQHMNSSHRACGESRWHLLQHTRRQRRHGRRVTSLRKKHWSSRTRDSLDRFFQDAEQEMHDATYEEAKNEAVAVRTRSRSRTRSFSPFPIKTAQGWRNYHEERAQRIAQGLPFTGCVRKETREQRRLQG